MLKELLDKLTADQRKQLMIAFEQESSHHIVLESNFYIGVNIISSGFEPLEVTGKWSYGRIK